MFDAIDRVDFEFGIGREGASIFAFVGATLPCFHRLCRLQAAGH